MRLYFRLVEAPTRRETDEGARLRDASGPTVLYVEDDASLRRVACHILRSHGYRVLEANDGVDAMGVMEREGRPDLLITDLVMPSMSGLELVEQVEKEGSPPPILLTSGFRPEFLLGWKGDPEAYPFLEKPWQIETLLGTVRSLLTQEAAAGG